MATTNSRQQKRAPVTLKIKFKSETLDQFVERYSADISHGGIFIRTKDPLAVGTPLRFEFQLKDATPLITGDGTVVWTREADPQRGGQAPGMGVRFDRLPPESQGILERILTHKSSQAEADQFTDTPTRVTPLDLMNSLQDNKGEPLRRTLIGVGDFKAEGGAEAAQEARPSPFTSDLDDFPDEAFEEATKVASLDALVKQTAESDPDEAHRPLSRPSTEDEITRARPRPRFAGAGAPVEARPQPAAGAEPAQAAAAPAEVAERSARRPAASTAPPPAAEASPAALDDRPDTLHDGTSPFAAEGSEAAVSAAAAAALPEAETTLSTRVKAEVLPASDDDRGSSNLPWIAAAAVLLLGGGAVGFWMLGRDKKPTDVAAASEAAEVPTDRVATSAGGGSTEPAKAVTPEPPPVPTVAMAIATDPPGATIEVVGIDGSETSPHSFAVEEGKTYTVRVSLAGYVSREIEVKAGTAPPALTLDAKARVLKVSSSPAGAAVSINGKRQPGLTPLDVPLEGALAKADKVSLRFAKAGFNGAELSVDLKAASEETDAEVVFVAEQTLAARVAAIRRPATPKVKAKADSGTDGDTTDGDTTAGDTTDPAKTDPAKTDPAKADPAKTDPAKADPAKADPAKTDPAKTDPAKADPAKTTPTKTDEPTPGFMKPTP